MNRAQRWRHRLWEISWGLQRYKVKKPVKKAIFDFGIADSGLNILNPHKRGAVGGVGAVGIRLMIDPKYFHLPMSERLCQQVRELLDEEKFRDTEIFFRLPICFINSRSGHESNMTEVTRDM